MSSIDTSDQIALGADQHAHEHLVDPFGWTYDTRHQHTMSRFLNALGVHSAAGWAQALWDVIDTNPMAFMYCGEPWDCPDIHQELPRQLSDDRCKVRRAQVRLLLRMLGGRFGAWSGDPHTEAEGWLTLRMNVPQHLLVRHDDPEGDTWHCYALADWLETTSETQLEAARVALIDALRAPRQALAEYHTGLNKRYADVRDSDA